MMETPQERERRLADQQERAKVGRRLRRVETHELARQSTRVRRLTAEQKSWTAWAEILEDFLGDESELPRTVEARTAAASALRELIAALGVEIAADWQPA